MLNVKIKIKYSKKITYFLEYKPLDLKMYSSNIYDSKILNLQLDNSNFYSV